MPKNFIMKTNLVLILAYFLFTSFSFAQITLNSYFNNKSQIPLQDLDISNLPLIKIEKDGQQFPDSYLLGVKDKNLVVATNIFNNETKEAYFVKSEVQFYKCDYLTLIDKKVKFKKMLTWGLILGTVGYFFSKKLATSSKWDPINRILAGEEPSNGVTEGIIGGLAGFSVGIIIGGEMAKKRINVKELKHNDLHHLNRN
jgi:hypothetical protein